MMAKAEMKEMKREEMGRTIRESSHEREERRHLRGRWSDGLSGHGDVWGLG